MKTLLTLLVLGVLGLNVFAGVGPDLSAGTDTKYFTNWAMQFTLVVFLP